MTIKEQNEEATTPLPCVCGHIELTPHWRMAGVPCKSAGCDCPEYQPWETSEMTNTEHDPDAWRRSPDRMLLLRYSEWLDANRINPSAPASEDPRSHADLVQKFMMKERRRMTGDQ